MVSSLSDYKSTQRILSLMHTLHRLFYLFTFYQNEYSSDDDDDDDGDEVIGVADNGCAQVGRIGSCRVPAFPPVVVHWHTHIRHPIVLVMTKYVDDIIMMTKYHHDNNGNDNA